MLAFIDVTVHTGRWRDYSYGSMLGEKVTLSSENAFLLIAFISSFDALVGNSAWSLICFLTHRYRATPHPRDALHHQQLALLRNTPDALEFAQQSANIGWEWRKRAPNALIRGYSLSIVALSVSVFFTAAGILSSQIASTGSVLLRSNACGSIQIPADANYTVEDQLNEQIAVWASETARNALAYAQNCYNNTLVTSASSTARVYGPLDDCNFYVKPTLNWNITNSDCPFGNSCSVDNSEVIKLDTGYLNSFADLGVNQVQADRVTWRKVLTCSPLTTTGFSNNIFHPINGENSTRIATYNYGENTAPTFSTWDLNYQNATFVYLEAAYEARDIAYGLQLTSVLGFPPGHPGFFPDPRLVEAEENYPLTLVFLPNRAYFTSPVEDPWFGATTKATLEGLPVEYYVSDEPGRVLACLEQAQIWQGLQNNPSSERRVPDRFDSNPNSPGASKCTALNDWWIMLENYDFSDIDLNDSQAALAGGILDMLQASSVSTLVYTLGQDSLQATSVLQSGGQLQSQGLPMNQWQIEVNNWFAIGLATMQQAQVSSVTGPEDEALLKYITNYPANDTIDNSICNNQMIRSTSYQSFSVLGLVLNFVLGACIIASNLSLRYIIPRLRKDEEGEGIGRKLWIATSALQLQRIAFESLGLGDWDGYDTVPLTEEGQMLSAPMISREGKLQIPAINDKNTYKQLVAATESTENHQGRDNNGTSSNRDTIDARKFHPDSVICRNLSGCLGTNGQPKRLESDICEMRSSFESMEYIETDSSLSSLRDEMLGAIQRL